MAIRAKWRFDQAVWAAIVLFTALAGSGVLFAAAHPRFGRMISAIVGTMLEIPDPRASGESALPTDQLFSAALRELLTKDRSILQTSERHSVHSFYRSRDFAPIWIAGNQANLHARSTLAFLNGVDAEGLDPNDYVVPDIEQGATPAALATAELRLTAVVLTYVRHVQNGRFPFSHFGADIDYAPKKIDAAGILGKIAEAENAGDVLVTFSPPHEGYKALKAKLAQIPTGNRSGEIDLREAVILANLERWRWMPRDLGESYVMVNIADYTLAVVRHGSTVFRAKIVVGEPARPTPVMSVAMKSITINPQWNVPASIAEREYLPLLARDAGALNGLGIEMDRSSDGSIHLHQPPGEQNVLGRVRFNLPNRFLVFQHDTPDKLAFDQHKRAFSHGCMRVENPLTYAETLLTIALPQQHYTEGMLRDLFGPREVQIEFPMPIPVHLTYQTAFVDESTGLETREDIYGLDARVLARIRITQSARRVAEDGSYALGASR